MKLDSGRVRTQLGMSPPRSFMLRLLQALALAPFILLLVAGQVGAKQVPSPVAVDRDGRISYRGEPNGDRVVDFSHAGFGGGGVPLPRVPVRLRVEAPSGDATALIQSALDDLSRRPVSADGVRGAVVLEPGRFELSGRLRISASGVVLRGSKGTVLAVTGHDRSPVITLSGPGAGMPAERLEVLDTRVPVGSRRLRLASTSGLAVGDRVVVTQPSLKSWINELRMDDSPGRQDYQWRPGTLDVRWVRSIAAVVEDAVELDAPLTATLEARHGGGFLSKIGNAGVVERCGVEHLRIEGPPMGANPHDEDRAWTGIRIGAARDAWVADVSAARLAGSMVLVSPEASRVTVQDCFSSEPVSEEGGWRRMTFRSEGGQVLFLRCRADEGRNDFTTGHLAPGPTVFLECSARRARGFSGAAGSWATGILFDNVHVDGSALRLDNLETWQQGVGWAAGYSMLWQCSAGLIVVRSPPGAANWAVGVWAQLVGDGRWSETSEFARPLSLYRAQLSERVGAGPAAEALLPRSYADTTEGEKWGAVPSAAAALPPSPGLEVRRGWLAAGGRIMVGAQAEVAWWRGSTLPVRAAEAGPALTRFVPGVDGRGATDDLGAVVEAMVQAGDVALRHHWGLWYDRRRDDHQRVRRPDGEVAAPFFEMPWARAGGAGASEAGWDGLSRHDLSRFNPWYFGRLRSFAALARSRGRALVNEMYFQHNILEAGAHWADFPWRSSNNINATGFAEPPPYVDTDGSAPPSPELGKRIFMAEAFYDVSDAGRAALHRAYIRHSLTNLDEQPNVLHTLGAEYSGPLTFARFWLEICGSWIRETGRRPLLALSVPKDVQDAILADPAGRGLLSVIDLKYWWRTESGAEFAPPGGTRLAPRQHERAWKGGRPSPVSLARMAREYRLRFPDLAVITAHDRVAEPWSWLAAGGSWPRLPSETDPVILAAVADMVPLEATDESAARQWALRDSAGRRLVAAPAGPVTVSLANEPGDFEVRRIDPVNGRLGEIVELLRGGESREFTSLRPGAATVLWVTPRVVR